MDGSFLDTAREVVLDRPTFTPNRDRVTWATAYGPYDLDPTEVHALPDLFEGSDSPAARKLWLDLYDAASAIPGFIPRVTSFRAEAASKPTLRLVGSGPPEAANPS